MSAKKRIEQAAESLEQHVKESRERVERLRKTAQVQEDELAVTRRLLAQAKDRQHAYQYALNLVDEEAVRLENEEIPF